MIRPLFVIGASRTGTTALTDYMNQHEEILVCMERYKWVYDQMDSSFFTFRRILDYEPQPRGSGKGETNTAWERHAELLANKDPSRLRWVGDKHGAEDWRFRAISENNPGAHFLITYRPIEEVVESFENRVRNPDIPALAGKDGVELGVNAWNRALRNSREYLETYEEPNGLIVSYHDFFNGFENYVPLLSEFLELEFDDSILKGWRETSGEFEGSRRKKSPMTEKKAAYIEENKDHDAEAWMLERIARQWNEPGLYKRTVGREKGRHRLINALMEQKKQEKTQNEIARRHERHADRLSGELEVESKRVIAVEEERRRLEARMGEVRSSRSYKILQGARFVRSTISKLITR